MIDYSKINDPEYFKDVLSDINQITDINVLSNLLKILSIKIANKQVDPIEANMLLSAIRTRNKVLTDNRHKVNQNAISNFKDASDYPTSNDWEGGGGNTNNWQGNTNTQEKTLSLHPTSASGHSGTISLALIIAGVAITTVMYTLLWIASSTR